MKRKASTYHQIQFSPLVISLKTRIGIALLHLGLQCLRFAPLCWIFKNTFMGTTATVSQLKKHHKDTEAIEWLQKILLKSKTRFKPYQWWYLMRLCLSFIQDRQLVGDLRADTWMSTLQASLDSEVPEPYGYDCAYVYVGLSLWHFQKGDMDDCIQAIFKAVSADKTWSYAEYLLGWYGLFDKRIDAISHFVNAVSNDWDIIHRMRKDTICQQHPEVIKAVQDRLLIQPEHHTIH